MNYNNAADLEPEIYPRDAHKLSRQNIDPDALKIMYRLVRHGYKAYLVGGGVRDLLLNKVPKDFDVATDATPKRVKALFRNSRIIGRRFKLVHVFFGNRKIIEVSTFRDFSDPIELDESGETDTNAVIRDNKYGTEETDALRRDITINALFYDLSSFSIIDYVGGMQDLRNQVVRIIGNPDERFVEDPVRLIRVIRHAARSGFSVERECWESLVRNKALILKSSTMRVFEEVKKDLTSGYALDILRLLNDGGLLEFLMPEITEATNLFSRDLHSDSKTDLTGCLTTLDAKVLDGEAMSSTAVLAILSLFSGARAGESHKEAISNFKSEAEIREHARGCFTKLSVPRKERERVEAMLTCYGLLVNNRDEENFDPPTIDNVLVEDFRCFLKMLREEDLIEEITFVAGRHRGRARRGHRQSTQRQSHRNQGRSKEQDRFRFRRRQKGFL